MVLVGEEWIVFRLVNINKKKEIRHNFSDEIVRFPFLVVKVISTSAHPL